MEIVLAICHVTEKSSMGLAHGTTRILNTPVKHVSAMMRGNDDKVEALPVLSMRKSIWT